MTNEEIELLQNAKNGNATAINKILADNKSLVNQIARRYFLLGGDRDDVLQEGMIGLFNAINSFDFAKSDSFKNYASKVVEREIITAIRRENTSKNTALNTSVITDINEFLHEENYPELDVISEENSHELMSSIDNKLSDFEKCVVELFLDGYNYTDIANKLNKSPKSIDNALTRIKIKLKSIREDIWVILHFIENTGLKVLMK